MEIVLFDKGKSPAKINRRTGTLYINRNVYFKLPKTTRLFVLWHELGHYKLNTKNECLADQYAFNNFAGSQKESLKGINNAMALLKDSKRRDKTITNLLLFDYVKHKNNEALKLLTKMKIENIFPKENEELLWSLLIQFLKERGIKNVTSLPLGIRETLLYEFFAEPSVLHLIGRTAEDLANPISSLFGWGDKDSEAKSDDEDEKKEHSGTGKQIIGQGMQTFAPAIGAAISGIASAFGVPVPPAVGTAIANMAGGSLSTAGANQAADANDTSNTDDNSPNTDKGTDPNANTGNTDPNAKDNKKTWLIVGGASAGVVILILVLILIFKR